MPSFVLETLISRLQIVPKDSTIRVYAPCTNRHYIKVLCLKLLNFALKIFLLIKTQNAGDLLVIKALRNFVRFYNENPIIKGCSSFSTCEIGLQT